MEAILNALRAAGYAITKTEDSPVSPDRFGVTITKDGLIHCFGTSRDISAYGITEAISWLNYKHEQLLAEQARKE